MINDVKNINLDDKIYMVSSPTSDIDSKEYEIISNSDVDKDLFILCNSKKNATVSGVLCKACANDVGWDVL